MDAQTRQALEAELRQLAGETYPIPQRDDDLHVRVIQMRNKVVQRVVREVRGGPAASRKSVDYLLSLRKRAKAEGPLPETMSQESVSAEIDRLLATLRGE